MSAQQPMVSYAQNFEDVMLRRVLSDVSAGFYIDLGACDPVIDSVTYWFYSQGWSGINVEPHPAYFAALSAARPRDVNLNVTVGGERGKSVLYLHDGGLSTTDMQLVVAHHAAGQTLADTVECETLTLQDIFDIYVQGRTVDFLKIDVEGSEAAILNNTRFSAVRPRVLVIEATRPNSTTPTWRAWDAGLRANRYVPALFDGLNRYYVRVEDADRRRRFAPPANVFDNFTFPPDHGKVRAGLACLHDRFGLNRAVDMSPPGEKLQGISAKLTAWLFTSALPLWWAFGADHSRGGFFDRLGPDGLPVGTAKSAATQAAQVAVFCRAGVSGWRGPWRQAAEHGRDALVGDQSWALGGSANAQPKTPSSQPDRAIIVGSVARLVQAGLSDKVEWSEETLVLQLGLAEPDRKTRGGGLLRIEAIEAAMAWEQLETGASARWRDAADQLATEVIAAPATSAQIGPLFASSRGLHAWGRSRKDEGAGRVARALFEEGSALETDRSSRLAASAAFSHEAIIVTGTDIETQSNRLRAALEFARYPGLQSRPVFLAEATAAASAIVDLLRTDTPGLWVGAARAKPGATGKELRNIANAILDLRDWAGEQHTARE